MMPLIYKGVEYAEGTKLKVKTRWRGIQEVTYCETSVGCFKGEGFYETLRVWDADKFIVEITEPVYPKKEEIKSPCSIWTRTGSGSWQSDDEIFIGLVIYILVMLIGVIFKERFLIWIAATILFFGWKNKK